MQYNFTVGFYKGQQPDRKFTPVLSQLMSEQQVNEKLKEIYKPREDLHVEFWISTPEKPLHPLLSDDTAIEITKV